MTANPLRAATDQAPDRVFAPQDKEERIRFWIDRGNRILWGQEPTSKGEWLEPKPHLHWVCINGDYRIEERRFSSEPA